MNADVLNRRIDKVEKTLALAPKATVRTVSSGRAKPSGGEPCWASLSEEERQKVRGECTILAHISYIHARDGKRVPCAECEGPCMRGEEQRE